MDLLPERYRPFARQFIKFGLTGTVGAVVDFGIYNILVRGFGFTAGYHVLGQPVLLANNISVLLAIISNFMLNKYWTFRDRSTNVAGQGARYFILNLFTWTLNQILFSYFTFRVPLIQAVFGTQKDNAAKVLAIGVILIFNFFGSKFLVFRTPAQHT